jgi:hypothetical protein
LACKLIKIGVKVARHSRKIVFQMAEVPVPGELFQTILERIGRMRSPAAATGWRKSERNHMKTTATTEAVSSPPGEHGIGAKNGVETPPGPGKKPVADCKKDL